MSPNPPDIIKTDIPVLTSFYSMGLLETAPDSLTEILKRSYYPVAVESLMFGGELKGIPLGGNVTGILYNKRILEESGMQKPPASWAELDIIGPKLTRWDGSRMLRPAIGSNDNWFLDYAFPTTVFGEGGKLIDAQGNTYIDVPEVYNAVDLWDNAINRAGYMVLGGSFASAFLNGEGAMWWAEPYYAQTLQLRGTFDDMAAVSPLRGSVTTGAVYRNHGYAVPTTAENKEEAWKFLEWLVSGTLDGGTPLGKLDAANGSFPLARQDLMAPYYRPVMEFFSGFMNAMEIATPNKAWLEHGFTMSHLSNALKEIIRNKVAPQQAIRKAELLIKTDMEDFKKK
jgi:multiple sugar transport system substrate-binding protein